MPDSTTDTNWITIVERNHSLLFFDFLSAGQTTRQMKDTFGIPTGFDEFQKIGAAYKINGARMGPFLSWFQYQIQKDPSFLDSFPTQCYDLAHSLIGYTKGLPSNESLRCLPPHEFFSLLSTYFQRLANTLPIVGACAGFQMTVEKAVRDTIASRISTLSADAPSVDDCLALLLSAEEPNYVVQDIRGIRALAKMLLDTPGLHGFLKREDDDVLKSIQQTSPEFFSNLVTHATTYGWLKSLYTQAAPADPGEIWERVRTAAGDHRVSGFDPDTTPSDIANRRSNLRQRLRIDAMLDHYLRALNKMLHLYTFRMDVMFIANHFARDLLHEAATRMGASYSDFTSLLREEIEAFFENNTIPDWDAVRARNNGYAYLAQGSKRTLLTGEEYEQLLSIQPKPPQVVDELVGNVACPGKAAGIVRVVVRSDDVGKVLRGDILVTTMTTPDLVIAMERASAIITDEGGIACHAAIVSRELGIPCIIGTRYASKVLRDYDAVSVDAFVGRVRKIKWAKVVRRSSGLMWKARSLLGHTKRVFQATLDMQGFDFLRSVDHQTWAADDELQQFRASLGKRIAEGKSYFREMYAKCTSSAQRLLAAASKLNDPIQLRNLSANALADLFDSYNEEYLRVVPFRALINILAEKLVAVLKEHLDKALPNPHSEAEIEELLQILIVPSQENLYVDEMRAFLHLCEQAISNPKIHEIFESDSDGIAVASAIARVAPRFEELLSEHIAEYGWVATARSSVAEWTKHDLLTRMKAIPISCAASKLQEIQQRRVQGLREKQRLISKYALGEQILKLLDIAGDYAFLRQYRIDIFFIADFKARYLEREISRRLNLDPGLFSSLTPMEVLSALRGQTLPSSDELVQRKHAYALYAIGGDLRVIPHKDIPLLVQRPQIENEVNSVKGSVAHRGVVVGRACVVMSRHDLGKCKGGDVIISPMTTPELVEALERAAAIVTDEGGALCHAAVISRELGIPCVVGTVNATELFRDGQLLKVDASQSQGTVEIVS